MLWDKLILFSSGPEYVVSWIYHCPNPTCANAATNYTSLQAETLHLKFRRYSRELIIKIGYRRFWHHQTMYELHEWLSQDLRLDISVRQVFNVLGDFLALLRAGQPSKVEQKLRAQSGLLIGIDGMQPEKGNRCLYIVREIQSAQTLLAESLDEGSQAVLSQRLFVPLKALAQELGLAWQGVVSDAQESIRLAVAQSLPGVPHQACQSHCLRAAGTVTFEADRNMKKRLKAAFRQPIARLQKRIQTLSSSDPYRTILADYADAIRATLLEGGTAPFELGGLNVYAALEALASSLLHCQKKAIIVSYGV
jgi:hypothetical protein